MTTTAPAQFCDVCRIAGGVDMCIILCFYVLYSGRIYDMKIPAVAGMRDKRGGILIQRSLS